MRDQLHPVGWALARLTFIVYIVFSVLSLVGGFLTAPLMTWYFFGDWRFWRHWRAGVRLLPHALRLTAMMLGHNRAFMFSVPLTSPPRSAPDPSSTFPRPDWPHGGSCGDCSNCCKPGGHACPLLDSERRRCRGYDSFYWRYFNCGRYPSVEEEIAYYDCQKWALRQSAQPAAGVHPTIPVMVETRAASAAPDAGQYQLRSPRLRQSPSSPPIQPAATASAPVLPMANHTASRCEPSQLKV